VVIDPVGTRRSAQFVRVNAAGVVADGMFIAATDAEDFAPDFEVEAAAQRLPDGYSVELRLPLMTLRYPYEGGAPWRIMVARSIPRESSMLLLSAPLTKDALNFIAELQPIAGLEDIAERVRTHGLLSVRPELTLRSTRRSDGLVSERSSRGALGAEIKWRPRADWVFDATLNPDFSQVELDVPQLAGNTRFALSVPEKRPFFLESTDVLDLPLAAFYSRSITDPGWGLRATWRGVQADATALTLRDDGGGLLLRPGPFATDVLPQDRRSQATLLRGRWHAEQFSVGALLSQRDETAERHTTEDRLADPAGVHDRLDLVGQVIESARPVVRSPGRRLAGQREGHDAEVLRQRVDGRAHVFPSPLHPGHQHQRNSGATVDDFRPAHCHLDLSSCATACRSSACAGCVRVSCVRRTASGMPRARDPAGSPPTPSCGAAGRRRRESSRARGRRRHRGR